MDIDAMFHLLWVGRRLCWQKRLTRAYEVGGVLGIEIAGLGTLEPCCRFIAD